MSPQGTALASAPLRERRRTPALLPSAFGEYQLMQQCSAERHTEVYVARKLDTGMCCYLTRLKPECAQDAVARRSLAFRARLLRDRAHPALPHVVGAGEVEGIPYLAFEHAQTTSLARLLARSLEERKLPPVPVALAVLLDLCTVVACLHEPASGHKPAPALVHCNINPQTVRIDAQGRVRLWDFTAEHASPGGRFRGSVEHLHPVYRAPELDRGEPVDVSADLWSIGALLSELLTLTRPRKGPLGRAKSGSFRKVNSPRDPTTVPAALEQICSRAMADDPHERYSSAAELRLEIEGAFVQAMAGTFAGAIPPRQLVGDWLKHLLARERRVEAVPGQCPVPSPVTSGAQPSDLRCPAQ